MKAAAVMLGAAVLLGARAMPAGAAPSDDSKSARLAAISAMFDACGERRQMEVYFEKNAELVVTRARASTPTYSDAQWKAFQAIVTEDLKAGLNGYLAFKAGSYAEHFTVADIAAMTAYCRSPVGRKVANLRGEMEADTFDARQDWLQSAFRAAISDAQQKVGAGGTAL